MEYFSARLIVVSLVDNGKPGKKNLCDESIMVFKAKDYQHAFERALELGKEHEHAYRNSNDQNVRWAFVEVAEVRCIGKKIDGVEVTSKLFDLSSKKPVSFDKQFHPEDKLPHQS